MTTPILVETLSPNVYRLVCTGGGHDIVDMLLWRHARLYAQQARRGLPLCVLLDITQAPTWPIAYIYRSIHNWSKRGRLQVPAAYAVVHGPGFPVQFARRFVAAANIPKAQVRFFLPEATEAALHWLHHVNG